MKSFREIWVVIRIVDYFKTKTKHNTNYRLFTHGNLILPE